MAPVCGLIVDRLSRRRLLVAINGLTGCVVLLLLLVHGAAQLWLIYLVMVLYGLSYSTLAATQSALLTAILPDDLLADANAAVRTIQGTLGLVAPLTGAGLFALMGPRALVILDATTFVAPVLCALSLGVVETVARPPAQRWRVELERGGAPHRGQPGAPAGDGRGGCGRCSASASAGRRCSRSPTGACTSRRRSSASWSHYRDCGAVIGGLTAAALTRRMGEGRLIALGLMLTCAGALLEIPPTPNAVLIGAIVFGLSLPWVIVGLTTLLQRSTPPELQGRVYAAADAVITVPQTISIALGAALIGFVGYRVLLGAMAATNALAGGYLVGRYRCLVEPAHQPRQHQRARPAGVG